MQLLSDLLNSFLSWLNANFALRFVQFTLHYKVGRYFQLKLCSYYHHSELQCRTVYPFLCSCNTNLSYVGMSSRYLGTRAREHLNRADINTKVAIKSNLYDCGKCTFTRFFMEAFKILKKYITENDTKIQEALLLKKLNPKLNDELYAKRASFLRRVCYLFSGMHYCSVLTLNFLVLPFFVSFLFIFRLLTNYKNTPALAA